MANYFKKSRWKKWSALLLVTVVGSSLAEGQNLSAISQPTLVVQIPSIPTSTIPAPTITLPLTSPIAPQPRPKPTPVAPLPRGLPAPVESSQPPVAPLPRGLPAPVESSQPPVAPLPRGLPAPVESPAPVAPLPRGIPTPPQPEPAVIQRSPEANRIATQSAGQYFDRNWNPQTGMVNAVNSFPWITLWNRGTVDVNTNAIISQSLLDQARGRRPLVS